VSMPARLWEKNVEAGDSSRIHGTGDMMMGILESLPLTHAGASSRAHCGGSDGGACPSTILAGLAGNEELPGVVSARIFDPARE